MPERYDISHSRAGRDVIAKQFNQYLGPPPAPLNSLPAPPAGFTGRKREIDELLALLDPSAPKASGGVMVSVVSGMGGVGKSALAVSAANTALERGWFSGALFVNLRGYDPEPLSPEQALSSLLHSLGKRDRDVVDAGSVYRQELTRAASELGGPILVLTDNAGSAAQLEPLLPGPGGHRVLVTSRSGLSALSARRLELRPLSEAKSLEVLASLLNELDDGSPLEHEPEAARSIARACAGLPLALSTCAALIRSVPFPDLDLTGIAASLSSARRLETLDDGHRSINRMLDLTVARLGPEQVRLLTLMNVAPVESVCLGAAAALADLTEDKVRSLATELADAQLLQRSLKERWSLHTLTSDYVRLRVAQPPVEEVLAALIRLMEYYADTAREHAPVDEDRHSRDLRSRTGSWFFEEVDNLAEMVCLADALGRTDIAIDLPLELGEALFPHCGIRPGEAMLSIARDNASRTSDRRGEAQASLLLGSHPAAWLEADSAEVNLRHALRLFKKDKDRFGQAIVWADLAQLFTRTGEQRKIIPAFKRALALVEGTGSPLAEDISSLLAEHRRR